MAMAYRDTSASELPECLLWMRYLSSTLDLITDNLVCFWKSVFNKSLRGFLCLLPGYSTHHLAVFSSVERAVG